MENVQGRESSLNENVEKKRKRVSKKSKRSWRKYVDIREIEENLDEVRRQERTGGIISQKKNQELFYLDNDNAEIESEQKEDKVSDSVTAKKRKLDKDESSDESSDEEERKTRIQLKHTNKTQKTGSYDLWSFDNNVKSKKDGALENDCCLIVTNKRLVKQPKTAYKVRSTAPALNVCHPGASYNPTFDDHQALLMAACKVEIMKEKEIEKIKRQLQIPSEEASEKLTSWEEEMSQGLFGGGSGCNDNSSDSEDTNDNGAALLLSGRNRERKTAKEKRKANERKREQQNSQVQKKVKVKENEVFRVKSIKKMIKVDAVKTKERQEKRQKRVIEASLKPQRLGRLKFEEMNVEIQLAEEVTSSLRNLKPEGNLFEDRFKSLQRRNIIEPRRPVMPHRKYKLKEYEKRSYKNFDLQERLKQKKQKN